MEVSSALGTRTAVEKSSTTPPLTLPVHKSGREGGFSLAFLPATGPVRKRKELFYAAMAALVLAASYLYPLFQRKTGGVTTCYFHLLTGKPCPLCGMTRSFAAFARLHVSEAFWYHLLGPFFFLALPVLLAFSVYALVRGRSIELNCSPRLRAGAGWFLLGALLVAWALKLYFFGANV